MCTSDPTGRITTAATRSLDIAAAGLTLNSRISIGVISAPPPAPVSPTSSPTTALPSTTYGLRSMVPPGEPPVYLGDSAPQAGHPRTPHFLGGKYISCKQVGKM